MNKFFTLLYLALPAMLLSHGTEVHDQKQDLTKTVQKSLTIKSLEQEVNQEYLKNIKPIFEKKCFNCHSNTTTYPFYYSIPGIKQLIDYDIKESQKHIDMSKDFPFISHETPIKDLKSIKNSSLKGTMPPLRYRLMHWDSKLTEEEIQEIVNWVDSSLKKLEE